MKLNFGSRRELPEPLFAFLMVIPTIVATLVVIILPTLYSVWLSLYEVDPSSMDKTFVGAGNYIESIKDPLFRISSLNTSAFGVLVVGGTAILGLLIALALNEPFKGRGIVRTLLIIPWAISQTVNGMLWAWIYNATFGALNGLLYQLGIITEYIGWLARGDRAIVMVSLAFVWSQTPFAAVLFLAALQTIPVELYRAAMVDGANVFKRFWYVTLPWLRPTMLIVLINATILALFAFNLIYIMTNGGPGTSTTVFAWWGYVVSFRYFYLGQGTAILFFLTFAAFALTFLYVRLLSRPEEQQV